MQQRDAGLRSLDVALSDGGSRHVGAEIVHRVMTTGPAVAPSWGQRYAAAATAPAYERAFAKLLGNATPRSPDLDARRSRSVPRRQRRANRATCSERRGWRGRLLIPTSLDPAVLLSSAGSTNPLRQISRVVQTVTDSWNGVTSAGVTAEWIGEGLEVADASPTFGQPSIPVYKADAFVPFSFEIAADGLGFMQELGKLLADAAEQLTATAYTTGTGSNQPTGLITGLAAASPSSWLTPRLPTPWLQRTFIASECAAAAVARRMRNSAPISAF